MGILALLILVDILMVVLMMYLVFKEKPKEHTATHPLVIRMREAENQSRAWAVETTSDQEAAADSHPAENAEDKAE